ncbi:glycogen debranching protein [Rhizobium sp. R72]|uniref:GH116 family glycosyl hydrolase n=1 Tax=unclassified Rhizobium TaxID=2613769 RepID=UPI000B5317B5|nr:MULTISPECIES: GH116 family glycosyl hydrolase [unclassified Rhizobium]OWV97330.1 glycogen debranching protein [Rhizobium sp. R72]OWV97669.1 glycogen debranching protein [Rhizobium sp. R711]
MSEPQANPQVLTPLVDGQLRSTEALLVPFMAPRLQGDCRPTGKLELSLWGSGKLANLTFTGWNAPFTYAPNRIEADGGGLYVAQSAPAVFLKGARLRTFIPTRRCAWWGSVAKREPVERQGNRRIARTGWGVAIAEERSSGIFVTAGATIEEAETALKLDETQLISEAHAYVGRCDAMPEADPLMRSMISQSLHAALSSIRRDEHGAFAGLAAGQAYSAPARTYYRDGYWTLQALLSLEPEAVRAQIDLLARGVQPNGEAPSGVILTGKGQAEAWEKVRQTHPRIKEEHLRPGDWWSDHFDSPLFFILTIGDYIRATGDRAPLSLYWDKVVTIFNRYCGFDGASNGLPMKPRHDRDWADNVYRHGYVAYDLGLWIGALDVIAQHGSSLDQAVASSAAAKAQQARASLDEALLQPSGTYADYGTKSDFVEDHLTLDSLTLLRFKAVSVERARSVLTRVRETLESRNNSQQPYGDWGVLCAFPPFKRAKDTREKSYFAYRYHNGSDWPYLSGLYAEQLLNYGMDGADYPLLRWWKTCLEEGWVGAVEYFSPPWGRGSLLQGWSSMPAAVALSCKDKLPSSIRPVMAGHQKI